MTTMTRDQVADVITRQIAEALMVPVAKVVPSARIFVELTAESIDIVDIRFRIEHELGIKIDQRAMFAELGSELTEKEIGDRFTVGFIIDYVTQQIGAQ